MESVDRSVKFTANTKCGVIIFCAPTSGAQQKHLRQKIDFSTNAKYFQQVCRQLNWKILYTNCSGQDYEPLNSINAKIVLNKYIDENLDHLIILWMNHGTKRKGASGDQDQQKQQQFYFVFPDARMSSRYFPIRYMFDLYAKGTVKKYWNVIPSCQAKSIDKIHLQQSEQVKSRVSLSFLEPKQATKDEEGHQTFQVKIRQAILRSDGLFESSFPLFVSLFGIIPYDQELKKSHLEQKEMYIEKNTHNMEVKFLFRRRNQFDLRPSQAIDIKNLLKRYSSQEISKRISEGKLFVKKVDNGKVCGIYESFQNNKPKTFIPLIMSRKKAYYLYQKGARFDPKRKIRMMALNISERFAQITFYGLWPGFQAHGYLFIKYLRRQTIYDCCRFGLMPLNRERFGKFGTQNWNHETIYFYKHINKNQLIFQIWKKIEDNTFIFILTKDQTNNTLRYDLKIKSAQANKKRKIFYKNEEFNKLIEDEYGNEKLIYDIVIRFSNSDNPEDQRRIGIDQTINDDEFDNRELIDCNPDAPFEHLFEDIGYKNKNVFGEQLRFGLRLKLREYQKYYLFNAEYDIPNQSKNSSQSFINLIRKASSSKNDL